MENSSRNTVNLLSAFMLKRGEESWRANFLASKFTKAFGESALGVIGAYLLAGWSFVDMYMLDRICTKWRRDPRRPLRLEKLLLELEFFPIVARRLSWQYAIYCTDPDSIRVSVQTLLELGVRHNVLFDHLARHPDSLALSKEAILGWSRSVTQDGKPLEWKLSRLPRIRLAEFTLEPVQSDWSATDVRVLYADEIAAIDLTPQAKEEPKRHVRRYDKKSPPEVIAQPMASTDQTIEKSIEPENAAAGSEATEAEQTVVTDESPTEVQGIQTDVDESTSNDEATVGETLEEHEEVIEEAPREESADEVQPTETATETSSVPETVGPTSFVYGEADTDLPIEDFDADPVEIEDVDAEALDPLPGTIPIGGLQDFAHIADQSVDFADEDYPEDNDDLEDASAPSAIPEIVPESASILFDVLRKTLHAHDPDWYESHWTEFKDATPWLNHECTNEWECVELLLRWFGLRGTASPNDPRLGFVASIVRNENLAAKKRLRELRIKAAALKKSGCKTDKLEAKGLYTEIYRVQGLIDPASLIESALVEITGLTNKKSAGPRAGRSIKKLQARIEKMRRFSALGSFLKLEPEIAFLRLYMTRSILEYDSPRHIKEFLSHPEFLLHPFEAVVYGNDTEDRRLSIPPPPTDDMRAIQAKCNELRFRTNEVRRYTDKPWKKPYIEILLEPTRDKFLKRLERYLSSLSEEDRTLLAPRARYRRKGKSAYSTLNR